MTQSNLKDVARLAGVSYKTVSRVVNGEGAVSAATRLRVESAISATGYRPNHSARSLRRGKTHTLRLIMYMREVHLRYERFQDEVIAAIVDRATSSGFSVLLELSRDSDTPAQLSRFGDLRSDATILLDGRLESPVARILHDSGTPTVLLVNPDADPSFGSIDADFTGGAFAMVRTLIGLGHRRIAHLADDRRLHSSRGRLAGYVDALRDAGIAVDESLILPTGYMRHHGHEATRTLLERAPDVTAIFCVNDLTAFGAIECATHLGRRVPADLSVTGFDDIALARHSTPPLTTMHIPWYEMAEAAADQAINAVESDALLCQRQFPVSLRMRETVAAAPAADRLQ